MRVRTVAGMLLAVALIAGPAQAFSTSEALSLVAMPLAVAAVSNVTGVPQDDLTAIVSRLNQANVPPDQFVQVVRYVPATFVTDTPQQPTLVQFVDQQTGQGVTGPALVTAIDQQLVTTYHLTPVADTTPSDALFLDNGSYIPDSVLSRFGSLSSNPLALALMPLAVAAVADLAGVPQNQLTDLVASLNSANVPPTQFVEVMRYVPVALISDNSQPFVQYVQNQVNQGVTGPALITSINQQLPSYGVPQSEITVIEPRRAYAPATIDQQYFPPMVRESVARGRGNPHGGPPGQLKKERGLQTGAEVVHGYQPGHQETQAVSPQAWPGKGRGHERRQEGAPMVTSAPVVLQNGDEDHGREKHRDGEGRIPPGQAKKMEERAPQMQVPPPQQPPGLPPGQAKKQDGGKQDEGHGRGHGKD